MDDGLDGSVRGSTGHYQMDGVLDVAKVGVAGSNPVVRSRQVPGQSLVLSSLSGPEERATVERALLCGV